MSTTTSTTPEPRDPVPVDLVDTGPLPAQAGGRHVAPPVAGAAERAGGSTAWWALLVLGVLTVLYGLLVMSLRPAALVSVAVLAGIGFLATGIAHFLLAGALDGAWRFVAYAGGAVGIGMGVAAFVWPGPTLYVLAVLTAWMFVVSGLSRVIAVLVGGARGLWWLGLVLGLFELLLGLWAIGSPVREALLFVNLVGIFLVVAGIDAVVTAIAGRARGSAA